MQKTTTYYEWNNEPLNAPILLGYSIQDYLKQGLLIRQDDEKYLGSGGFPWLVTGRDGIVIQICYSNTFPDILGFGDIWTKKLDDFHAIISSRLKLIEQIEDFKGDVLTTVFRDNSIAIACFSRRRSSVPN